MRMTILMNTAGLALATTVARAQTVTYDYDKSADFASYRTYAWVAAGAMTDDLNHRRIVSAVDAQLAAKGLVKVEVGGAAPDVLIGYRAKFDQGVEIRGYSSGWGAYRFGGHRNGYARVDEIVTGTLVVDIVDAKRRTIVWRGVASKEIDVDADPAKRDRNVQRAAEKLFKHYPPGK